MLSAIRIGPARRIVLRAALLMGAAIAFHAPLPAQAPPGSFSYSGNFISDDDKREFFFTLSAPASVTLKTLSYAGGTNAAGSAVPRGGFDPTLSLFDSNGTTLAVNGDGGCGRVNSDAVTSSCWDAFISASLPAGNYRVVLTQSDNQAAGPLLSDSFLLEGLGNFTQPPPGSPAGFWDYYPNQRASFFALDIQGVTSSQAPAITSSATAPFGIMGRPYTPFTLTAQAGAVGAFTWSVVAGGGTTGLPAGLTLSAAGVLQGTPGASGTFTFIAKADDGVQPLQQTVTVVVYAPLSITTSTLPPGTATLAYGPVSLAAAGGGGSNTWTSPNLPQGLSVSAAGQISGTPGTSGTFPAITFNVADAVSGQTTSRTLSLTVAPAPIPPLQLSGPGNLPGISAGSPVSGSFSASGGRPPYIFSASGLPPGVSINAGTGALTGAPSVPGNYTFSVLITDSQPLSAGVSASLPVLGITTSSLPSATTTGPYSAGISAAGGTPPYTFSGSGIPPGLSLSAAGAFTGTALAGGNYALTVTVGDATGLTAQSSFNLTVAGSSLLSVPGGALSSGTVGAPYSDSLTASGGRAPYSWSFTGGALPDGLSLSGAGDVSGTPSLPGTFNFTASAQDSAGATASGSFSIIIAAAPLTLSTGNSLPNGVVGTEYPLQILTPAGGVPPYTFSISAGALPPGLSFANGQISGTPTAAGSSPFTVTVTDAAAHTANAALSIVVNPAQADLILSQTFVSFALTTGSGSVPDSDNVPVRSSDVRQLLNYSIALSPSVPWLTIGGAGTTPGSIVVGLNSGALSLPAALTPYTTNVTVTCVAPSPCAGRAQTVNVSVSVSAPPPHLSLSRTLLSFSSTSSTATRDSQTLGIQNSGGGTLTVSSVSSSDSWLSVSGIPSTVPGGPALPVTVTVDSTGLGSGYYRGSLTVVSSAGSATAYVGLLVSRALPNLILTSTGTQFQLPAGAALGSTSGSFGVGISVGGPVTFSAAASGAPWLRVSAAGGSASSTSPGTVNFSIDPAIAATLAPGAYFGTIRVTSAGVADSPADFHVVLNVTPAAEPVKPILSVSGLYFLKAVGGSPDSGSVRVFASSATPVNYQASASVANGTGWLSVTPSTGSTSAASPADTSVQVNPAGLAPGIYRGGVSYAFSSAAVRTVNVTLLVVPAGQLLSLAQTTESEFSEPHQTASCQPGKIVVTQIGLVDNFAQLRGLPVPLSVLAVNDCGTPVIGAQVTASFSNGDAPFNLVAVDSTSGIYSGTWTPIGVSAQAAATITVIKSGLTTGTARVSGEITANASPVLTTNGSLHVYNPLIGGAVAPGTILQIYGSNLAGQPVVSSTVPLPTTLGDTSVSIGGLPAPLYYVSPGQINAQAPFELSPGSQYEIIVNSAGALTSPGTLQIAPAVPGVAAYPSGLVIAQHLDFNLVSKTLPAAPGETIVLYLSGLGATDHPVATGAASPASPLARPVSPVSVTLGGIPATVQFVGLTPGLVGLYQINLTVPASAPQGDLPLIVTQAGVPGNITTLPVKP